ncbi:Acbp from Moniliophthora Perniciosa [Schizopora paradoxa]|uniref:Acbp from Moniliophthora Perniciosa n=1 Tax=Schizopora paradoxa TaxID=27342 RepID=A0A0H2RVD8_9AGAM|nr:Acbp from Moniliophthora Perniciosa [Schizopora paradoxa]
MSKFDKAVEIVGSLPKEGKLKPSTDDQLYFYSRFKQATIGKCNVPKPGMLDFTGKAKWNAWNELEDKKKEEAEAEYVAKLKDMLSSVDDEESKASLAKLEAE